MLCCDRIPVMLTWFRQLISTVDLLVELAGEAALRVSAAACSAGLCGGARLSLKNQSPAVERAKPICLVSPEFRPLDSMKTPTLFAGMGSANKYP